MTIARFKREIRDLQVWCSSCMVAFAGSDPIGVMIGAKRPGATLVHRIAVRPDHQRQGHGRHLLTSLSSKLSILGPSTIVAEVPGAAGPAHDLLAACGFTRDAVYSDYILDPYIAGGAPPVAETAEVTSPTLPGRFVIPVTIDDLAANGLLGESNPLDCWERSVETLTARSDEIAGLAIATGERIEAYLLYSAAVDPARPAHAAGSSVAGTQILAIRSTVADAEGARLRLLLGRLIGQGRGPFQIGKVHSEEIPAPLLEDLGFRFNGLHGRYAATARAARS